MNIDQNPKPYSPLAATFNFSLLTIVFADLFLLHIVLPPFNAEPQSTRIYLSLFRA